MLTVKKTFLTGLQEIKLHKCADNLSSSTNNAEKCKIWRLLLDIGKIIPIIRGQAHKDFLQIRVSLQRCKIRISILRQHIHLHIHHNHQCLRKCGYLLIRYNQHHERQWDHIGQVETLKCFEVPTCLL